MLRAIFPFSRGKDRHEFFTSLDLAEGAKPPAVLVAPAIPEARDRWRLATRGGKLALETRRGESSRSTPLSHATAVASISIRMLGSNRRVTPRRVLTGLHPALAKIGTSSLAFAMKASTSVV